MLLFYGVSFPAMFRFGNENPSALSGCRNLVATGLVVVALLMLFSFFDWSRVKDLGAGDSFEAHRRHVLLQLLRTSTKSFRSQR